MHLPSCPPLNRISVPRAVVPQLHQLILLHRPVLLAHLPARALLVRPPVPQPHEAVYARPHCDHAQRDSVAAGVARSVSLGAMKADMMPDVLPRMLPNFNASIAETHPSQRQPDNDIQPARHQETRKVVHRRRRVGQQDGVPQNAYRPEDDTEHASHLKPVREKGRGHVRHRAEKVARHREQLHLGRRPPSETVDDGGEERREACLTVARDVTARKPTVEHRVHAKLRSAKRPHLPVRKRPRHVPPAKLLARLGAPVLPPAPHLHQRLLSLGEKVRRARIVGQRKVRRHAEHDARQAFDDEDPSPAAQPPRAVEVPDAVRQQAAQRAGDGRADEQVPHAQRELVLGVEEGQVHGEPWEQPGLDGAEQQPARHEAGVRVDEARARGDEPPRRGDEGDPPPRGEELEHEVRGNLEGQVRHEEDRDGHLELRRREVEVGFEPVEAGVANVYPVVRRVSH
ncbi:hypothetical protein TOPH_02024 [Tolypocladium ophioglossoides CBS 100239]|uniref:Uncharacterized protein n=1 Tax=Tolypocladium ophioglossoides (strain CBS 100239) TaxID=1163406 RepID=A0A0L0NGK0_TOLOC|nr:hypothetical protein TOPH_02024 [Tolypocladium ophioglossoides CBS 100239]